MRSVGLDHCSEVPIALIRSMPTVAVAVPLGRAAKERAKQAVISLVEGQADTLELPTLSFAQEVILQMAQMLRTGGGMPALKPPATGQSTRSDLSAAEPEGGRELGRELDKTHALPEPGTPPSGSPTGERPGSAESGVSRATEVLCSLAHTDANWV